MKRLVDFVLIVLLLAAVGLGAYYIGHRVDNESNKLVLAGHRASLDDGDVGRTTAAKKHRDRDHRRRRPRRDCRVDPARLVDEHARPHAQARLLARGLTTSDQLASDAGWKAPPQGPSSSFRLLEERSVELRREPQRVERLEAACQKLPHPPQEDGGGFVFVEVLEIGP